MEHYVTLFNSLFLPQGLALYQSMVKKVQDFNLWILCVDEETYSTLDQKRLPFLKLLKLSDWETPELLEVKKDRSIGEYCWTLTPFAPRFVFSADPSIKRVTYLDADLWFLQDPSPIFNEFNRSFKKIMITEHAYAPEYDKSATCGKYCVQFMIFDRLGSEYVRDWWEKKCLEWCYDRIEEGKFGDQKYLDDWSFQFTETVHILQHKEWIQAPWNAIRFPYSDAIIWHFQGLRIEKNRIRWFQDYTIPKVTLKHIYQPYINELLTIIKQLNFRQIQGEPESSLILLLRRIRFLFRKIMTIKDVVIYSEKKLP